MPKSCTDTKRYGLTVKQKRSRTLFRFCVLIPIVNAWLPPTTNCCCQLYHRRSGTIPPSVFTRCSFTKEPLQQYHGTFDVISYSFPLRAEKYQQDYSHINDVSDFIRRQSLSKLASFALFGLISSPSVVTADESEDPTVNRPYAPVESLIPAMEQKILLDEALDIASQLATNGTITGNGTFSSLSDAWTRLRSIVESPNPSSINGGVLSRVTIGKDPARSFIRLSGTKIRKAMNIYTENLRFGETYVLTASPEIKKQMIREDRLPDVKTVISADLDLRDLYRNRVQTLMDDAQAELHNQDEGAIDAGELRDLFAAARETLQKWFDLIRPSDIEEATRLAKQLL